MSVHPAQHRRMSGPAVLRTPDPWSLHHRRRGHGEGPALLLRSAQILDMQMMMVSEWISWRYSNWSSTFPLWEVKSLTVFAVFISSVFVFGRIICGGYIFVSQLFDGVDVQHDVVLVSCTLTLRLQLHIRTNKLCCYLVINTKSTTVSSMDTQLEYFVNEKLRKHFLRSDITTVIERQSKSYFLFFLICSLTWTSATF